MPGLALCVVGIWFVSLVLVRSAMQWRRTGASGIKPLAGRPFSIEWIAGVVACAGIVLIPIAAIAGYRQWPLSEVMFQQSPVHLIGAALAIAGIAGSFAAQVGMGDSWRIGLDDREKTQLVEEGLYGLVRNPIFTFFIASMVGFMLVLPNVFAVLSAALVFIGIELQVRFVEEPYLMRTHGGQYAAYLARVGRFWPGTGKLHGEPADG